MEELDTHGLHITIDAGFSVPSGDLSVCTAKEVTTQAIALSEDTV